MTKFELDVAALQRRAAIDPTHPRVALRWQGHAIGSVEAALAGRLSAAGLPLRTGDAALDVQGDLEASLAVTAHWLRDQGLAGKWRDELLAVTDSTDTVHGRIERAAVRPLGITTHAVHLVGRSADGRVWVQQRALDKATDPGLWDTLMGGLISAGESIETTLERETWEEAGLRPDDLLDLRAHGSVWVRRPVREGYMVERLHAFEAVLRDGAVPVNQDGEVQRFDCIDAATLRAGIAADRYTLEAVLVLLQVMPQLAKG